MITISDRNRLAIDSLMNSILDENKGVLMKTANSNVLITDGLERYSVLLDLIDFNRINRMVRFMMNLDYKNFYMKSFEYRRLLDVGNVDSAWEEINRIARAQVFADDESLMNDETLELGRCANAVARTSVLESLLYSQFEGRVRFDTQLSMMLVKVNDQKIVTIDQYDAKSFAKFLSSMIPSIVLKEMTSIIKSIEETQSSNGSSNVVIQFNDCYIKDGKVYHGIFGKNELPRFFINRNVYEAVKTGKPTIRSEAVDQLLLHLCNFDERIRDRVVSVMSTVFLNSKRLKTRFNVSPRIYGKDGANGKTTFLSLLENAFGSRNVKVVSISDLDNERTVYTAANALIAIDSDSTGKTISDDAAANFKSLTSGEVMKIRGLFKNEEQVQTSCMMMALSNVLPASSDKSSAYLRRLEISRCDYQLTNDESKLGPNSKCTQIELTDEFFDEIYSDKAAQYLVELLLLTALQLLKEGFLPPKPKSMNDIIEKFAEDNDSAAAFILDVGLDKVVGYSVAHVKEMYHNWCEENDMTELKRKFNETLEDRYSLQRKVVNIMSNVREDDNSYIQALHGAKQQVRAWVFSDAKRHKDFMKNINSLTDESDQSEESEDE
jgi:hypothetical protein